MNKYLVQGNEIIGPVKMEKPDRPVSAESDYNIQNKEFEYAITKVAYDKHLASLPRYPISGVHNWKDGELIGECEVKLQKQARSLSSNYSWRNEGDIYDIADPGFRRIVAIPVKGKDDEKVFSESDMKKVQDDIDSVNAGSIVDRNKLLGFPVDINELCDVLQNTCQLLNGIKPDAVDEKWWSDWDESVLQSNIEMLKKVQPFYIK